MPKTIAIACDHAGFPLKEALKKACGDRYRWLDLGTNSTDSVSYADFGEHLAKAIGAGRADYGILICGTGIGISIAANRYAHIRAAVCTSSTMARLARAHNNANVLALGARIIGAEVALDCIDTFMTTDFEGGRHQARVDKLNTGL